MSHTHTLTTIKFVLKTNKTCVPIHHFNDTEFSICYMNTVCLFKLDTTSKYVSTTFFIACSCTFSANLDQFLITRQIKSKTNGDCVILINVLQKPHAVDELVF